MAVENTLLGRTLVLWTLMLCCASVTGLAEEAGCSPHKAVLWFSGYQLGVLNSTQPWRCLLGVASGPSD